MLVVAATNRKDMLDSALLRPGRFDRHISVDLPDKQARVSILKMHTRNKPLAEDADIERIALETFGFSGAQLESLTNEGAIYALRDDSPLIGHEHLSRAIDKVMMGRKRIGRPPGKNGNGWPSMNWAMQWFPNGFAPALSPKSLCHPEGKRWAMCGIIRGRIVICTPGNSWRIR